MAFTRPPAGAVTVEADFSSEKVSICFSTAAMEVRISVTAVRAETLSIFATGSPFLTSWPFFTKNSVIFTSEGSSMSSPSPASRVPPPRTVAWTEPSLTVASSTLATGPSWASCCRARAGSSARPATTPASTPPRMYRRTFFFFVWSIVILRSAARRWASS